MKMLQKLACLVIALCSWAALAQTSSRTETVSYHDNLSLWVLGQTASSRCTASVPASTACDGDVVSQTDYGWKALPSKTYRFGKPQQTFSYDSTSTVASGQLGMLKTITDGRGGVTTLTQWKRGVPGKITYPATTDQPTAVSQSATINDDGTIATVTDENGYKTCYDYDAMGRLAGITYPSETQLGVCDTSRWAKTTLSFKAGYPAALGLPPGHWRQLVQTGQGRKTILFDALWRPVVEQTLDLTNIDPTKSEVAKRYDTAGRLAFQSYPMQTVVNFTDPALKGTKYAYDALDRVWAVTQDSELGALTTVTDYMHNAEGYYTRVKDPRGIYTRTFYQAFDEPSYDVPVKIQHANDYAFTEIARDPFGKPTSIKRRNGDGTVAVTRTYAYNANQELCRVVDPETGATVMGYDAAGNLAWSASGVVSTIGCDPEGDHSAIAPRRIDRTYDARNRLAHVYHPDGRGNVAYAYAPDGLLQRIETNNDASGNQQAITSYEYNRRRLLEKETLQYGALINWPVDYVYDGNGHLSAQAWHGVNVTYAPDALGRPTQAGSYASGVSYHPNGAIKQFTYGNGIVHTLTQNVRGLPDTSKDAYGTTAFLIDGYDYDQNGNVAAISDGATGRNQRGNRTMAYDGLNRLTSTTSPMFGTATYTYDVLNNLTQAKVTGGNAVRDRYYCYNAQQQLAFLRTGPTCTGSTPSPSVLALEYDLQGNLKERDNVSYGFDFGNRLRSVSSPASAYAYDGHGRRVWDRTTDDKYSHYLQNGQLSMTADERRQKVAEYVYLQGSLIAIRERDVPTNVHTVKYQHTDALGSPVVITDANRTVLERSDYEPYGEAVNRAGRDGPGYTGHVEDAATGLMYMQQRYYDPGIGRFLSVDPVTALNDPVGYFGRYHYANNNPYKFTDPDGRAWGLAAKVVKVIVKGGDVAGTVAGAVSDAKVLFGSGATAGQRLAAGASLATEVFSPVSARDVKAGVAAIEGAADKGRDAQVIYRRGDSRETATRLERKATEAENSSIGIHGVSGSTTKPDGPCSSATCGQLESAGFKVHDTPTRADPNHKTIELPSPVTREDAERFNSTLGRGR